MQSEVLKPRVRRTMAGGRKTRHHGICLLYQKGPLLGSRPIRGFHEDRLGSGENNVFYARGKTDGLRFATRRTGVSLTEYLLIFVRKPRRAEYIVDLGSYQVSCRGKCQTLVSYSVTLPRPTDIYAVWDCSDVCISPLRLSVPILKFTTNRCGLFVSVRVLR